MSKFCGAVKFALLLSGLLSAETHVFWYKCIQNNYALQDNPGPDLPDSIIRHEGMMMSATLNQRNNAQEASFVIGSGLDDGQGRCGVFWNKDLCQASGTSTNAVVRAEYRDSWSSSSFSSAGPIAIRCGVVDFQGNIDAHEGVDNVPTTATWADGLYPLSVSMGYNPAYPDSLMAEEIINITAPASRVDGGDAVLDKQFAEIDVTDQVNWILSHTGLNRGAFSGQYAVVFLVAMGQGSVGKINTYSAENCVQPIGGDAPWTRDGNTFHLVVEGDLQVVAAEKNPRSLLSEISIGDIRPNPFTGTTRIEYNAGANSGTIIKIYRPDGRVVLSRVVSGRGEHVWDAQNESAGVYLCRLTAGTAVFSRTIILFR